jgi:glycosyltransferase involved in cell wall biosynthesis
MGRVLYQDDGLGVYSYNLLKNMIELDRNSDYLIFLRSEKSRYLLSEYPNVSNIVIPAKSKILWDQVWVAVNARKYNADIIFNPKFSIPVFTKIPCVFVLQSSDWYVNPGNYEWWDNIYIRLMIPLFSRKAKKLFAISHYVVDDLVKYAGIDRNKVTMTYAAPSPHFKPITDTSLLRKYSEKYKLPKRFIFNVARTLHTGHQSLPEYPGGNVENLIKGYRHYQSLGGTLPLVIAGKNIETYLMKKEIIKAGEKDLFFTGFVPHEEIVYLYNLAEFFVLTTLCESFGLPIVEAMASGCPAIVPTTGACPEVAGGAATLVNPLSPSDIGEAMASLEKTPDIRKEMQSKGLKRAADFSWQQVARRTLEVFEIISAASSLVVLPYEPDYIQN